MAFKLLDICARQVHQRLVTVDLFAVAPHTEILWSSFYPLSALINLNITAIIHLTNETHCVITFSPELAKQSIDSKQIIPGEAISSSNTKLYSKSSRSDTRTRDDHSNMC